MKLRITLLTAATLTAFSFAAHAAEKGTIMIMVNSLDNPYYASEAKGASEKAQALGYKTTVLSHGEDVKKQNELIDTAIGKKVQGIILPEIKAPWFHHQEGKDIAASTLKVLKEYGYTSKQDKVYLQCFDANELKRIKNELEPKMGMDLNLVQLIAYTDWNETQQKQADGKWVNYSYDWMFKPGAMARARGSVAGVRD
ncbi:hypothetical protein NUBL22822_03300 [Klebsiella pneumoniae]|nr:hypothetical protein NUBL22822_03300 [Klebsiella pneumoniae]